MAMNTKEPTFGVPERKTAMVEDSAGTRYVAHHEDGTWWEGHYADRSEHAPVQLEKAPVKLVDNA